MFMHRESIPMPAASRRTHSTHPSQAAAAPAARRQRIAALVRERAVHSQFELQELLAAHGIAVNQATLSRDLRAMGVLKGPDGYELPTAPAAAHTDGSLALYNAVHAWLRAATSAENLVVLKTPAGGAQPLALALDQTSPKEAVGTIAGDDTILVVCKNAAEAKRLARMLLELRERRKR